MIKKLIFTIGLLPLIWYGYSQENPAITLETNNSTLQVVLKKIEEQTAYSFVYNETVDLSYKKSLSIKGLQLTAALEIIFSETNINWKINKRHIILTSKKAETPIRKVTISGYITDSVSSEVLIGANIYERISGFGTATNEFGYYSLTLPPGEIDLRFSYTGYETENRQMDLMQNEKKMSG